MSRARRLPILFAWLGPCIFKCYKGRCSISFHLNICKCVELVPVIIIQSWLPGIVMVMAVNELVCFVDTRRGMLSPLV